MRLNWLSLFVFVFFPYVASAAVSISEVAWMGSSDSANHEWIELHNDGLDVAVDGWVLSDGMNLSIELAGTIPANGYVVLERTSDDTVSGQAFLIYTGALVNTGAILKLEKGDGALVDQVNGGEDWQNIGGDNVTKETAQYTTSGWVTAEATPGRRPDPVVVNDEVETEAETEPTSNQVAESSESKSGSGESVRLILPDVTLVLDIDSQSVGYVHQPISFTVKPSGIGKHLIDSLSYEWNFGDGFTDSRKDSRHVFLYPGKYVVTVYASFKRQEQVARHEITILPVTMSLTTNRAGDVQINNDSPYEIDVSGYRVRGDKNFVLPARSIILPNQTITIPSPKLGQTKVKMVALYDTETTLVASILPKVLPNVAYEEILPAIVAVPTPQISALSFSRQSATTDSSDFSFVTDDKELVTALSDELSVTSTVEESLQTASLVDALPENSSRMAYLGLAGIMFLGVLGIYATPRRNEKD